MTPRGPQRSTRPGGAQGSKGASKAKKAGDIRQAEVEDEEDLSSGHDDDAQQEVGRQADRQAERLKDREEFNKGKDGDAAHSNKKPEHHLAGPNSPVRAPGTTLGAGGVTAPSQVAAQAAPSPTEATKDARGTPPPPLSGQPGPEAQQNRQKSVYGSPIFRSTKPQGPEEAAPTKDAAPAAATASADGLAAAVKTAASRPLETAQPQRSAVDPNASNRPPAPPQEKETFRGAMKRARPEGTLLPPYAPEHPEEQQKIQGALQDITRMLAGVSGVRVEPVLIRDRPAIGVSIDAQTDISKDTLGKLRQKTSQGLETVIRIHLKAPADLMRVLFPKK